MAKMKTTLGVYAGIFNKEGKLLLRRREEKGSIIPGKSFYGDWELPGGGVEEIGEKPVPPVTERYLARELCREVQEEIGMAIEIATIAPLYPTFFQGPNGCDLAVVIPVIPPLGRVISQKSERGEIIYVSPQELRDLADRPKGEQLLSGWGKRMCRMALLALRYSKRPAYAKQAEEMLQEIWTKMGIY